jgi:hypothetical protein
LALLGFLGNRSRAEGIVAFSRVAVLDRVAAKGPKGHFPEDAEGRLARVFGPQRRQ